MSSFFDCPDGTIIEVKSDKTRRFRSDACQCVLVLETDTSELDYVEQVCDFHKTVADADLVSTVFAHVRGFNEKFGNVVLTDVQSTEVSTDKTNEKARILALGNSEIRADRNNKDAIEAQLRSKGR